MHKYTRKKILIGPSSCKKYILDKLEYNNPINPYQKKQVAQECHTEKKNLQWIWLSKCSKDVN